MGWLALVAIGSIVKGLGTLGGVLILAGANSAAGLRSMPVRYLFLDEVDKAGGQRENNGRAHDTLLAMIDLSLVGSLIVMVMFVVIMV